MQRLTKKIMTIMIDGYTQNGDQDQANFQSHEDGEDDYRDRDGNDTAGLDANGDKLPKPYSNTTHPPSTLRRKPPPHKRPSMGYIPRPPNVFMLC